MDTPLNNQLKECSCETNHNGMSILNENLNFLELKTVWGAHARLQLSAVLPVFAETGVDL